VKSVVLRGLRDMVTLEVLASLKEVKSLSIDIESGIVHPLSWIDADTLTSLSVFGFALHALSSETGKLKVMPNVSSLDVRNAFFCFFFFFEKTIFGRSVVLFALEMMRSDKRLSAALTFSTSCSWRFRA
jgi:hypothetical protein